ncbi:MAG: phytanoyl-CoA dioxygenase family protein [Nostoc sp.]|uniref:phytanoyl-CoA dioxygenase family protein n=1 Tax=Nostoc sp. TaxID=1180 RepID=UPI002FF559D1
MKIKSHQLEQLLDQGYVFLSQLINQQKCREVLEYTKSTRNFGLDLFSDEADFRVSPHYKGVNPVPGRNLLEKINLSFIEENEVLHPLLTELLGDDYYIVIKKVICGVPKEWIPNWVCSEIDNLPVANLGCFIKPEYRDITYFRGIDFHQDIIDYKNCYSDFITLYIYLDEVSELDSPLFILPESHTFGATTFPHDLVPSEHAPNGWAYSDRRGHRKLLQCQTLTGFAGDVWFWHPCFLHGTQPTVESRSRISLRYIIAKSATASNTFLDHVNSSINAPLSLENTRDDISEEGKSIMRGNTINGKT